MIQKYPYPSDNAELLTPKEAAAYLRVPLKSIYHRGQRRELGHIKLGRLLRFKKSERDRVLEVKAPLAFDDCDPRAGRAS